LAEKLTKTREHSFAFISTSASNGLAWMVFPGAKVPAVSWVSEHVLGLYWATGMVLLKGNVDDDADIGSKEEVDNKVFDY
jgi:hypothetical protein